RSRELRLDDPELLLCLCELLRSQFQSSPTTVRDEADFFHQYLLSKPHIGLYDEREFFLGEFALLAGTASRMLFRREEATRWFERAEARFVLTANSATNIARLAYQRLALRTEERRFEEVLELAPIWHENFLKLELPEDALKCRFLEAAALRETDRTEEANAVLENVCKLAETLGTYRLQAQALSNLSQNHRVL